MGLVFFRFRTIYCVSHLPLQLENGYDIY